MRRWRKIALVALLGLLWLPAGGLLRAEEAPTGDLDGFVRGLEAVRDCLARGQPEKGLERLQRVLEEHAEQEYARARRAEVEDLARRLSFRAVVEEPDPRTLVKGRLQKWNPATGEIKISFTPTTAGDLTRSKRSAMLWLPMTVRGPCKLEVRGGPYPDKTKDSPRMIFGGDESGRSEQEVSWQITFGVPPYTEGANEVWMPAIITRYDGDNETEIEKKDITPAKAGKSYKLLLTVTKSSIVPKVNGKPLGKAPKPKDVYGDLGFEALNWKEATFVGEVEPSWIQERIDEALHDQREAFDKTYDPKSVLPAWLFEAPTATPAASPRPDRGLPGELEPEHLRDLVHVFEAMANDDCAEALATIARLRKRGAAEAVCAYLAATIHEADGETEKALEQICLCTDEAPGFLLGWSLRGDLLRRLGRTQEALAAYRSGIEHDPGNVEAYEMAALSMLWAGDFEAAQIFVRAAAAKGLASKRLTSVGSVLVKAERGPTFSRVYEVKSRNYHVLTDIDKSTAVEAAKVLEQAHTSYRVNFEWVARDKSQLYKVYLFGGRSGFMQYQEDLRALMGRPAESAAGLYSGLTKQLLIWNLPSREEMFKTIRHEGFHQYLDRIMPDPPTWLNEGLAVYHEHVELERGSLKYGQRIRDYVELLEKRELMPLGEFLFQPHRKFYERGHQGYAQAWAFVHMLKHGGGGRKALFDELVKRLQTDAAPREVLRRVFPDALLKELDAELAAHLASLQR